MLLRQRRLELVQRCAEFLRESFSEGGVVFADLGDGFFPSLCIHAEQFLEVVFRDIHAVGVECTVGGEVTDRGLFCFRSTVEAFEHPLQNS